MKKLFCLLLACVLLCNYLPVVSAVEQETSVEQIAVNLINDALSQPNEFALPNLSDETLYICKAIHPYKLENDALIESTNIEYYLVKTENYFVACITLCYVNNELISACLNIGMAEMLNAACDISEAFQIVANNGTLYIKTADGVTNCSVGAKTRGLGADSDIASAIDRAQGSEEALSVSGVLSGIVTNPVISRTSKILSVPYVSQEGLPICWAAAAAAYGQYYKGSAYAKYSASNLAAMVGVGNAEGTMNDSRKILSDIFNISTEYCNSKLSNNTVINLFQQSKPILAGFAGYNFNTDKVSYAGHMVVLCGYNDGGTGDQITYYVRDSNTQSIMSVIAYSDDELVMDYYSGIVMYWLQSAYYVYIP